jgi:ribosome-binding protein aMBF1 (putative translation factor)
VHIIYYIKIYNVFFNIHLGLEEAESTYPLHTDSDKPMGIKNRTYSNRTSQALRLFASLIKTARKRKGWSESELAERCGSTRATVRKMEQGYPGTEIGSYFEVANLLDIPLFAEDDSHLSEIQKRVDLELSVLPKRIRKGSGEVFDDF